MGIDPLDPVRGPATEVVLATHNDAKVEELRDILAGLDVHLRSASDVGLPDVEETGSTFVDNALLKARAGVAACGLPCIADDSGLVVDALGGAPGVHSARFAALHGSGGARSSVTGDRRSTDRANLDLLLRRMADVAPAERTAHFVCAAVLALPDGTHEVVEAAMSGLLLDAPRGDGGFGYDPIFLPDGHDLTTAEMTATQKHAISHRGLAFRRLRPAIAGLVAG